MKWSIDRTTTVGLAVALLALVILSIISYLKIQEFQKTTFWVQHTQQTTVNIQGLLSHIKDAETGNFGYLLTGNETYLQPLETGRAGINAKFDLLQTLTNNNPQQQQQLSLLKRLIVAKLTDIEQTIALRRSQGYEAALGVVKTYKNKHLFDEIRAVAQVMKAEELRLLKQGSQAAQVIAEQTTLLIVTNSIFALLVLAIALLRTNSDAYRYQQNKAEYYQIAEKLPIIFWMCDANLSKVLYVSPAYEEIWGRTREMYANFWSFTEAIHPEDREQAIAKIKQNAKIGFEIEYRIIRPDNSIRWICDRAFPIYNSVGQVYRLAGFAQDITQSKHSLAQIQQLNETLDGRVRERTAELEAANSQLEAFTYSASHDLREPLRVIASYAQIVLEDYSNQLPAVAIDYLRRILASTQRLERLIQNLLTYSQLSRSEIPIQPVALTSIVNDAMAQLNATQQQGMIIIESPLPVVMGNYLTLVQVVSNLLSNAVKFVTPGLTPQVRVYATQQQDNIRLWVEDNGIGVAPEFQERIFEVFARLHGSEVYPGTGIGLAIVQKGLQRMGGRVGVESQVGEGSRFWIELPAFSQEARS